MGRRAYKRDCLRHYMENKGQLKLTIELVPATSWRKSLKRTMSKKKWKKLKEQIFAEYDCKCSCCETKTV